MVLGAGDSKSTGTPIDEQALISKMYRFMLSGGALLGETTLEQAFEGP